MAVKVMLAPALAKRDEEPPTRKPRAAGGEPKPKRRRSSVYDADGNEVFITLVCLKCRKMRPLAQFGLRRMGDGAIRNQPWCRTCRSGASAENPSRKRRSAAGEALLAVAPSGAGESSAAEVPLAEKPLDPGALAAQVVAALHGGRR
jgi:hypothetical protein